MKASSIHKYIAKNYPTLVTPTIIQIQQLLPKQKAKAISSTKSYGELIEWCRTLKKPTGKDDGFVLGYMLNEEDDSFAFVVSTPRLLKNASNRKNICADGTYKIVWVKYPLVAVGTVDRMCKFHLIALCLTSNERESEYSFVFNTITKAIKKHVPINFKPEILISDAAYAIRNAFYSSFKSAEHNVICWAHIARHINDFKFQNAGNKEAIKCDIRIVQTSPNKERFDHVCDLFLQKYEDIEPNFCAYMQRTWFGDNSQNWYTGYLPFTPEVIYNFIACSYE